jgi:hypothetical protein
MGQGGLFVRGLIFFRLYCVFISVLSGVVLFILCAANVISLSGTSSDIILVLPPIYLSYILASVDLYIKKNTLVKSNMLNLYRFLENLKPEYIHKPKNARIDIYNSLLDWSHDFKSYKKEMRGVSSILLKIFTWSPPLYHQQLEEINIVQDKIKYALTLTNVGVV